MERFDPNDESVPDHDDSPYRLQVTNKTYFRRYSSTEVSVQIEVDRLTGELHILWESTTLEYYYSARYGEDTNVYTSPPINYVFEPISKTSIKLISGHEPRLDGSFTYDFNSDELFEEVQYRIWDSLLYEPYY